MDRNALRAAAWPAAFALATMLFVVAPLQTGRAAPLTTLYTFAGGTDGQLPAGGVVLGPHGRLYGTTTYGGAYGNTFGDGGGEVYELVPPTRHTTAWTKTSLVNFYGATMGQNCSQPIIAGNGVAGYAPDSPPTFDKSGNIYAAASASGCDEGTVVELSPGATTGAFTIANALQFQLGYPTRQDTRGNTPLDWGGLVYDASGNVYGTTVGDGENGAGEVFELGAGLPGNVVNLLISFSNGGPLGNGPNTGVIFDHSGNLYGTTGGGFSGGPPGEKVYEYASNGTATALYTFNAATGDGPGPIVMHGGKIYGTAASGGSVNGGSGNGSGVVYELSHGHGGWAYTVLHTFSGTDGQSPFALVFDVSGEIIGNASGGGTGFGTLFKLTPPAMSGAPWTETTLWTFTGGADGASPTGALAIDKNGTVYGTTGGGGSGNFGTVFKFAP